MANSRVSSKEMKKKFLITTCITSSRSSKMEPKEGKKTMDSNAQVGEIDTSAPFQSVKQAVSLFGAVRFMKKKSTPKLAEPHSSENIIAKEARLHLAEKELDKFKEQLQHAEAMKTQALRKLEEAKNVVDDLQNKLLVASKLKDSAVKDTDMSMTRVKLLEGDGIQHSAANIWRESLQSFRDQYVAALVELTAAKKDLTKIRQDYNAFLESIVSLLKQASDADEAAKYKLDISSELSHKIMVFKELILQEKLATEKAQLYRERIFVEKNVQRQAYEIKIEASARQLQDFQKEFAPEFHSSVKLQLESKLKEIKALQQEMDCAKVSDLATIKDVALELGNAKEFLQEILQEENSLKLSIESVNLELRCCRNEVMDATQKEAQLESLAENLYLKLEKGKSDLEACAADEFKLKISCDKLTSAISQLPNESERARQDVQDANAEIKLLKKEKETHQASNEKAKLKLQGLMQEAARAKSAEAAVLNQIKLLSEQTNSARSSLSSSSAKLMLSKQEYGSLKHKAMESSTLTEMKVAAALAQMEAIMASENEFINRLHLAQKELEELKVATADAMKREAMSEAARAAIEGELCRLHEVELRKAAKEASETPPKDGLVSEWSPVHHKTVSLEKMLGDTWKSQNGGGATLSKRALLPNLSGIRRRR